MPKIITTKQNEQGAKMSEANQREIYLFSVVSDGNCGVLIFRFLVYLEEIKNTFECSEKSAK